MALLIHQPTLSEPTVLPRRYVLEWLERRNGLPWAKRALEISREEAERLRKAPPLEVAEFIAARGAGDNLCLEPIADFS